MVCIKCGKDVTEICGACFKQLQADLDKANERSMENMDESGRLFEVNQGLQTRIAQMKGVVR